MDEQASWKGHTFTMAVFGGIVVLCAIFFVLGMIVGRTQGQKIATVVSAEAAAKAASRDPIPDPRPELTFYESVDKNQQQPMLEPAPAKQEPELSPSINAKTFPPASKATAINFQVSALKNKSEAEKLVNELKKKKFRAFMLTPAPADKSPLYRVQVGPIADPIEAESIRQKLRSAGYPVIPKP